jgi:CheY-like chemotaxis protein
LRILIVDDDPATLLVASMALQYSGGYEVLLANSGTDAIKCARENRPDAILLDIVMHDLDGLAVLRKLRSEAETGSIPVIFHTARNTPAEIRNLMSSGAKGVIGKPTDPLELGNEIRRILAKKQEPETISREPEAADLPGKRTDSWN